MGNIVTNPSTTVVNVTSSLTLASQTSATVSGDGEAIFDNIQVNMLFFLQKDLSFVNP